MRDLSVPSPGAAAALDMAGTIWSQFVLARALARCLRRAMALRRPATGEVDLPAEDEPFSFCYADTHAGSGRLPRPATLLERLQNNAGEFSSSEFFDAVAAGDGQPNWHPGSWILAGRVLQRAGGQAVAVEMDVNDIDAAVIERARAHREAAWVRLWTHDWFLFLRSRLAMPAPLHFVFIDPPPDDARGPAYAIDAAILLETRNIPYMITYPLQAPQEPIDQIGRTGLELTLAEGGSGVLLGGGAEQAVLDLLSDLRRLAQLLGGEFTVRLPRHDDYTI